MNFIQATLKFIGFIGCMLAMNISWTANHDVGWAIIHSMASWLYIFWHLNNHIMFSITAATLLTNLWMWYRATKDRHVRDRIFEIVSFGDDKPKPQDWTNEEGFNRRNGFGKEDNKVSIKQPIGKTDISYEEEMKQIKEEEEDVATTRKKDEGKLRAEDKDKDPS